jgi:hypothetical protein
LASRLIFLFSFRHTNNRKSQHYAIMATMAIAHQNHHLEQKKQHPGDFSTESDVGENWQNMM